MKKSLALLIGLGLGLSFLWLAAKDIDIQSTWAAIRQAQGWYIAPFLASLTVFYLIKAYRWELLLRSAGDASWRGLFPTIIAGYAANTVLPMQFGELVRAYLASRTLKLPLAPTLTSLVLERGLDFASILFVIGLAALLGGEVRPELQEAGWVAAGLATVITLGLTAYVFFTERCVRLAHILTKPLPRGIRSKLLTLVEEGADGVVSIRTPSILLTVLLLSGVQWLLMGLCIALSLEALALDLHWTAAATVLVLTAVGVSLPTAPGYVGTIQLAFVLALQPFGVSADDAFAASIFYHTLAYATVTLGGLLTLRYFGLRFEELRKWTASQNSHESQR